MFNVLYGAGIAKQVKIAVEMFQSCVKILIFAHFLQFAEPELQELAPDLKEQVRGNK